MKHVFCLSLTESHVLILIKSEAGKGRRICRETFNLYTFSDILLKLITPAVKGICCTKYVSCSRWTIMSNTHDAKGLLKSDYIE